MCAIHLVHNLINRAQLASCISTTGQIQTAIGTLVHAQDSDDFVSGLHRGLNMNHGIDQNFPAMPAKIGVVVLFLGHAPSVHAQIGDFRTG